MYELCPCSIQLTAQATCSAEATHWQAAQLGSVHDCAVCSSSFKTSDIQGYKHILQASHLWQQHALCGLLSNRPHKCLQTRLFSTVCSLSLMSYAGRLAKEGCKILTCGLGLARAVCNLSLMASYMRRSAAPTEGRTSFSASSKWRACTWGLCGCALLAASGALLEPFPMLPPEVSPGPSCACRCSCGQGGNDFKNAES